MFWRDRQDLSIAYPSGITILESMILLLGSGFIGSAFLYELQKRGLKHLNISRATHDYTDPTTLHQLLRIHEPEFVINAAGFTGVPNVDECESRKIQTLLGNVVFPANLAYECSKLHTPFGHVSSGCVYNGHPAKGFTELDPPNFCFTSQPCSFYSGTKALAEGILAKHRCYIWRLRMPFDHIPHPKNYITKLLTYDTLLDRANSFSHRGQCVAACMDLWQNESPYGIYNVVNPGQDFTIRICDKLIKAGLKDRFDFFHSNEAFAAITRAPRSNTFLNTDKLQAQGIMLPRVEEAFSESIRLYAHSLKNTAAA